MVNLPALEEQAKAIIPQGGFGYIVGGSEDEWTLKENTAAFDHVQIVPCMLKGGENPSTKTSIFGMDFSMLIIMAPAVQGLPLSKKGKKSKNE